MSGGVGWHFAILLVFLALWVTVSPLADAGTIIDVGETDTPQNIVLLVIDGMGSYYVSPGGSPRALDGSPIVPADVPSLEDLIDKGVLVPDLAVPTLSTGPAHSVLITGYSGAEQETAGFPQATIYDVLRDEGFLCIAIMHKGDFAQLRDEQDVILYSQTNSINEPSIEVQVNNVYVQAGIIEELEYWESELPGYLEGTDGIDRYTAYGQWELDASKDIVSLMAARYPETKYILTTNVGVVDSAGHYRGADGYIDSIEGVDSGLEALYEAARSGNAAFVVTADHGMAFKSADSARGGHASEEYYCGEAATVPMVLVSPNVVPGVLNGEFGQEDVAPTILSVLDIPQQPRYANSKALPVKDYASLWVTSGTRAEADVEVYQGGTLVSNGSGDSMYIFSGLKPKINYIVRVSYGDGTLEQEVYLDTDRLVRFEAGTQAGSENGWETLVSRESIASVLIIFVIIGGLLVISRIKD